MIYPYKFRIYPTKEQIKQIQQTFGSVRFVYNYYLAKRIEIWSKEQKTFDYYDCAKDLTQLKKEIEWLQIPHITALQTSLKNLDDAYKNFFVCNKNGKHVGYPKFKSKKNHYKSYQCKNGNKHTSIRIEDGKLRIPKIGLVKCRFSKQIRGVILNATIIQSPSGKYFVSLCCDNVDIEHLPKTGKNVGVDIGIKDLIILSNGEKFQNHKYLKQSEKKLTMLQRKLSRKTIDSNNWNKARKKVASAYERITNQRVDTIQKLTTKIVKEYDTICVENLNIICMTKNRKLAKALSDASFGRIVSTLEYKAQWYGKQVIKIDRFFPSSQTCSCCGARLKALKDLSIRSWICPSCGVLHDRDVNAAINILNNGLLLVS